MRGGKRPFPRDGTREEREADAISSSLRHHSGEYIPDVTKVCPLPYLCLISCGLSDFSETSSPVYGTVRRLYCGHRAGENAAP